MEMIVNLTQHPASADQIAVGVIDLAGEALARLKTALTFDACPSEQEIINRAQFVAGLVGGDSILTDGLRAERAMIGGALWLMAPLAAALRERGIEPVFAFSVRETEEQKQLDGSIRKVAVFRHTGFVPAVA